MTRKGAVDQVRAASELIVAALANPTRVSLGFDFRNAGTDEPADPGGSANNSIRPTFYTNNCPQTIGLVMTKVMTRGDLVTDRPQSPIGSLPRAEELR